MAVDPKNFQKRLQMGQILMQQFSEQELRLLMKEVIRETIREEIKAACSQLASSTPTSDIEYLTVDQICKILQVSKPTLSSYTKEGIIKAYRFGRSVRYIRSDIATAMQQIRNKNFRK